MGQSNQPHNLAVVNYDKGATMPITGETVNFGNNLTKVLEDSKYQDSDVHLFDVNLTTESDANKKLEAKDVDAALIIPENFSQSMVAMITKYHAATINNWDGYISIVFQCHRNTDYQGRHWIYRFRHQSRDFNWCFGAV
ncbi:MAG: YhgE/Pip domain-containing protein [Methanobacterium sp.]